MSRKLEPQEKGLHLRETRRTQRFWEASQQMSEWSEWMNEWMTELKSEWVSEWIKEWMSEQINVWMNKDDNNNLYLYMEILSHQVLVYPSAKNRLSLTSHPRGCYSSNWCWESRYLTCRVVRSRWDMTHRWCRSKQKTDVSTCFSSLVFSLILNKDVVSGSKRSDECLNQMTKNWVFKVDLCLRNIVDFLLSQTVERLDTETLSMTSWPPSIRRSLFYSQLMWIWVITTELLSSNQRLSGSMMLSSGSSLVPREHVYLLWHVSASHRAHSALIG